MCEILLMHPILFLCILILVSITENQVPGSTGDSYSQSGYGIISSESMNYTINKNATENAA